MKLHQHPGIGWPPSWLWVSGSQEKKLPADSAILTNVAVSRIDPVTICYMTTQIQDDTYIGTLSCKDAVVCRGVYAMLQSCRDKPLSEISNLELPKYLVAPQFLQRYGPKEKQR